MSTGQSVVMLCSWGVKACAFKQLLSDRMHIITVDIHLDGFLVSLSQPMLKISFGVGLSRTICMHACALKIALVIFCPHWLSFAVFHLTFAVLFVIFPCFLLTSVNHSLVLRRLLGNRMDPFIGIIMVDFADSY